MCAIYPTGLHLLNTSSELKILQVVKELWQSSGLSSLFCAQSLAQPWTLPAYASGSPSTFSFPMSLFLRFPGVCVSEKVSGAEPLLTVPARPVVQACLALCAKAAVDFCAASTEPFSSPRSHVQSFRNQAPNRAMVLWPSEGDNDEHCLLYDWLIMFVCLACLHTCLHVS